LANKLSRKATNFESIRDARRISWETTPIEIMKPTPLTLRGNHRSLITDYNYHSFALESFNTNCGRVSVLSLWDISRSYFKNEARYDFLGEVGLFAAIFLIAFLPLINNAYALVESARAIGNF
jgi:hypothetical protein